MENETTGWSEDGQWYWDGSQWNEAISPDGQFIYNGTAWAPFTGSRSPMPALPAPEPVASPALPQAVAPSAAPSAPLDEYPAWIDPTEVERLNEEKARSRALAKQAPVKAPPVDWGEVHESARTSGRGRLERMSRFLLLMVLFWSLMISLALYGLFVYLPAHPLTHSR